jgi:mannose-1-phosphate guanylyltransferase
MKAVLLAAGLGTRLRPLTDQRPKCMVEVGGRPLLEWTLEWLGEIGVEEVTINLHHCPDVVVRHFGDRAGSVAIRYLHEPELLGTAGTVRALRPWLDEERYLVLYADNIIRLDLNRFITLHERRQPVATVALFHRDDVSASGVAELGEDDRILSFTEKPAPGETTSHWVSAGVVLCEASFAEFIPPRGNDIGRDVLPRLAGEAGLLSGYAMGPAETLLWIDTPTDLARVDDLFATGVAP